MSEWDRTKIHAEKCDVRRHSKVAIQSLDHRNSSRQFPTEDDTECTLLKLGSLPWAWNSGEVCMWIEISRKMRIVMRCWYGNGWEYEWFHGNSHGNESLMGIRWACELFWLLYNGNSKGNNDMGILAYCICMCVKSPILHSNMQLQVNNEQSLLTVDWQVINNAK